MGLFEDRIAEDMKDPEFRAGYEEASRELEEHCIVFNWHGDAPNKDAGDLFAEEALEAVIAIAEKHGCHVGGGFQVEHDPCYDCARLAEDHCPIGPECIMCNPPVFNGSIVHMTRPTITGIA